MTLGRTALVVLGAAVLLVAMAAAAMRGLADVAYTRARLAMGLAEPGRPVPPLSRVLVAEQALREALALDDGNPHYVEQFARTQELKGLARPARDAEQRRLFRQAAAALRLAARQRPGSPYTWADLARVKLRLGELDWEFYGALERANRLGPWEPAVQLATLDVGLSAWWMLPRQAKGWVVGAFDRALLRHEPNVREISRGRDTYAVLCKSAGLPPRAAAYCVKK